MEIYETFSQRQKRLEKAGQQDIYQYDTLPGPFREQVVHIWKSAIGEYFTRGSRTSPSNSVWEYIHDTLAEARGLSFLPGKSTDDTSDRCIQFLRESDTSGALDIIQLSFEVIESQVRDFDAFQRHAAQITRDIGSAIEVLNHRFLQHSIGYQYLGGKLVPFDSQFAHAEIVTPALS